MPGYSKEAAGTPGGLGKANGNGEVETMTATVLGALRANISHVIIPAPAISTR